MEKIDLFHSIQERLAQDLATVVNSVKDEYKSRLGNPWILDYLNKSLENPQTASLSILNYNKEDLEANLNKVIDEKFDSGREIFEIKDEEVHNFVNTVGNLYELVCLRTNTEISSLESKIQEYSNSKQLIKAEFDKSKAFNSKKEHQEWLAGFSNNIRIILDYAEKKSQALSQKNGFIWKARLAITKVYLKNSFGIDLNLTRLPEDISLIRKAILNSYQKYEQELIKSRYK